MSIHLSRFAALFLVGVSSLHAQNAAPAGQASPAGQTAAASPAEAVPPYELKRRSEFAKVDPSSRAPFWPIGWVKRKGGPVATQASAPVMPQVQLDEKAFRVTSILLGSGSTPSLAVVNGRAYSEGEFLRMPKGSPMAAARVRVQRINDGHVVLQYADQTMVAALVRPELSNKKGDEPLLDPDR